MIRRPLIKIALLTLLVGAALLPTATAQDGPHVVEVSGYVWDPTTVEADGGDEVRFEFDQADDNHNVFIELPNGNMVNPSAPPACPGEGPFDNECPPGADPVTYQVPVDAEDEKFTYICRLHAYQDPDTDEWLGMVGTITVGDGGGGGGPAPMANPTSVGPPWETGTEPPWLRNVLVRGVNGGVRLRVRTSQPGMVIVRARRHGRVVLTRRYRRLPAGVIKPKLTSPRLRRGRHLVTVRGRDKWGEKARPRLIRERVRIRY